MEWYEIPLVNLIAGTLLVFLSGWGLHAIQTLSTKKNIISGIKIEVKNIRYFVKCTLLPLEAFQPGKSEFKISGGLEDRAPLKV